MAKRAQKRKKAAARKPRLPMTKRVVTTRVQFGNVNVDQAFVAADDGDCPRVARFLDKAASEGANVALHRKQLMQDCRVDRGVSGLLPAQSKIVNPYTVGALVVGLWAGSQFFK